MRNIFLNRWVVFFLLLPQVGIYYFQVGSIVNLIHIWQLLIFVPFLIPVFLRVNTFNILFSFLFLLILLSAYLNGNITSGTVFNIMSLGGICYYLSNATKNFKELITGLYYLFATVMVLNFITMLVGAFQINGYYLLGGKNAISHELFPAIPLFYLYSYSTYNKLKPIPLILILISAVSFYLSGSGTATILALLTFLFIFLPKKVSPNLNIYLILYTIAFFALVIFRLQNLFANFITFVLKKDLTFTGRTFIWDRVLDGLHGSWILGLGRESKIVEEYFYPVSATHNGVLQVLVYSGIIGLILFTVTLLIIVKKLKKYRKNPISKILSFSIFSYLVIGLTESVFFQFEFWLLLVLAYDIERIINQNNDNHYAINDFKKTA